MSQNEYRSRKINEEDINHVLVFVFRLVGKVHAAAEHDHGVTMEDILGGDGFACWGFHVHDLGVGGLTFTRHIQ